MFGLKKSFTVIILFAASFIFFAFFILLNKKDLYFKPNLFLSNGPFQEATEEYACSVPKLNPWDPMISKWIAHPQDLPCILVQPYLTYIDYNGYLRYNETEFKTFNDSSDKFNCFYRTFDRCFEGRDNCIKYSNKTNLTEPTKLSKDGVEVECLFSNKTRFYFNIHAHPAETEDRIFAKPTEDQLSVLLLMIDSTSYSVLQRNLPLTYNYTKNVMGIKYFEAYNKIGDNSFPNMMAMLTGKRVYDEQDDMMAEFNVDYYKIRYDTFPLIWKMFSGKGYATAYNEDTPLWGLFHYSSKGFYNKPVDFFYHTVWRAVYSAFNKNHTSICFGNIPRPQLLIDLAKRHVIAMKNKLNFMYHHSTEVSHDRVNEVQRLDKLFLKFFEELFEENHLNRTVLIFGADHGHRYSQVRSTTVGLLEERLPFYGLWFPAWFYKLHPHIEKNIDDNRQVLSSSFDAYETMKDVLDANYDGVQRKLSSRGLSQLYPLPKQRTCKSAGIPDHYCTCVHEKILNLKHKAALDGASSLVNILNEKLENMTDLCYKIKLKQILYASQIDFDDKVKKAVKSYDYLKKYEKDRLNETRHGIKLPDIVDKVRIGIETEPFEGRFEALLSNVTTKKETSWMLDGSISRTNSYAGLSNCVKNKQLEKICSCKDVNLNVTNKNANE